jgi:hypothetical protein
MSETTYNVRVWKIEPVEGKRATAYRVRWIVAKRRKSETFGTKKLAESFRSALVAAARKGEAFDVASGLPVSMMPKETGPTWLAFAMDFIDMKWPDASPGHRRSTADGLVTITLAMTTSADRPPDAELLRKALRTWAFSTTARAKSPEPPAEYADVLAWIT